MSVSYCTCKTSLLIEALNTIVSQKNFPFVKIVAGDKHMLGESGSITLLFFDAMGNPVGVKGRKLVSVHLNYFNGKSIEVTKASSLDESAGKLIVKIDENSGVVRGSFSIEVELSNENGKTSRLKTAEAVQIRTKVNHKEFAYELTSEKTSVHNLKTAKSWIFPEKVTDF